MLPFDGLVIEDLKDSFFLVSVHKDVLPASKLILAPRVDLFLFGYFPVYA
jgi:hypothetical protein